EEDVVAGDIPVQSGRRHQARPVSARTPVEMRTATPAAKAAAVIFLPCPLRPGGGRPRPGGRWAAPRSPGPRATRPGPGSRLPLLPTGGRPPARRYLAAR